MCNFNVEQKEVTGDVMSIKSLCWETCFVSPYSHIMKPRDLITDIQANQKQSGLGMVWPLQPELNRLTIHAALGKKLL